GRAIRALRAHARHSQGHCRNWSGLARSRFRSPTPGLAARARAKALRVGEELEQSRRVADRNRPKIDRTIVETNRQLHRALAFESRLLAEQIDAERNIRAGLLACHLAQTGRETIKRAGNSVHVRRSLDPLLRADGRQKLFDTCHRNAQFTLEPAITVE